MEYMSNSKDNRLFSWSFWCFNVVFVLALFIVVMSASDARARSLDSTAPGSFSHLVKKARPAVVFISTVKVVKGRSGFHPYFGNPSDPNDPFREFFDRYFGDQAPKNFKQKGLGSGFIIDKEGYILTNNHVVEKSDEIIVTLADEKEFSAEIIGRDPKTDLALIRIKTDEPLEHLPLGDSDDLEVGDWVVAIGNPFGLGNTVTAGIVSFKSRNIEAGPYDDFIQTDAAINPGNSGGPLLNTAGDVIGINTVIYSQTGGNIGIGFAIPINMAKDLLPQLKKGKVVRGWLGVMIQKITPELKDMLDLKNDEGALVADVSPNSPASEADIKRGDVIVSFDGKEVKEMKDLPYLVGSTPVNKEVVVEVIRKGKMKSFKITVGELKDEVPTGDVVKPETNLGMMVEELTPQLARSFGLSEKRGLVVVQVQRDSAATEAGIRPGDLILELNQEEVTEIAQFNKKIQGTKKGDTLLFLVKRSNSTLFLTLKVKD